MHLHHIYINGFRNFKEATVSFNKHSLIIGANDVGKTNLIYAMRLLLDRGLSDYELGDFLISMLTKVCLVHLGAGCGLTC